MRHASRLRLYSDIGMVCVWSGMIFAGAHKKSHWLPQNFRSRRCLLACKIQRLASRNSIHYGFTVYLFDWYNPLSTLLQSITGKFCLLLFTEWSLKLYLNKAYPVLCCKACRSMGVFSWDIVWNCSLRWWPGERKMIEGYCFIIIDHLSTRTSFLQVIERKKKVLQKRGKNVKRKLWKIPSLKDPSLRGGFIMSTPY
jgi:hypothetical protein